MTKLVIDIDDKNCTPIEGDTITFHNGKWQVLTHGEVFCLETKQILKLTELVDAQTERIKTLEEHIKKLAQVIKEK